MPQILIETDGTEDAGRTVVYRERVALSDLESDHFSGQLVERVGWAVRDADEIEQQDEKPAAPPASTPSPNGDVDVDRMDLALAVGAGLDGSGGADQGS